jgi:hypothetical protein
MAMAPLRLKGSGLLSTRKATVPSPCPAEADVMDTHGAAEAADQEHSRGTVTATLPVPPLASKVRGAASKLGWHRAGTVDGLVTLVLVELPQPEVTDAPMTAAMPKSHLKSRRTSGRECISAASKSRF